MQNDAATAYCRLFLGMAFADASSSSSAVLYSILTLSASHLHGQRQALGVKAKALRQLNLSAGLDNIGLKDGLQSIAASMLLGVSEVRPNILNSNVLVDP